MANHELNNNSRWATARQEKMEAVDVLPPTQAVLGLVKIINQEDKTYAERLLLEGLAYLAHQPPLEDQNCRLLKSFDNSAQNSNWLLNLHERFGYIRQMGYLNFSSGYYNLTPGGAKNFDDHIEENGIMPIQQQEIDSIIEMTVKIRNHIGLSRRPINL